MASCLDNMSAAHMTECCCPADPGVLQPYAQCGGKSGCPAGMTCEDKPWSSAACAPGTACTRINAWFYQCMWTEAEPMPPPAVQEPVQEPPVAATPLPEEPLPEVQQSPEPHPAPVPEPTNASIPAPSPEGSSEPVSTASVLATAEQGGVGPSGRWPMTHWQAYMDA
jgi:hypothetical protein